MLSKNERRTQATDAHVCCQKSNKPTSMHNSSFLSRKRTSRENGCVSAQLPMATPPSVNVSIGLMRTVYRLGLHTQCNIRDAT